MIFSPSDDIRFCHFGRFGHFGQYFFQFFCIFCIVGSLNWGSEQRHFFVRPLDHGENAWDKQTNRQIEFLKYRPDPPAAAGLVKIENSII